MEIEKLRARLKNVNKKAIDYSMTVQEARALLAEIDVLLTRPVADSVVAEPEPVRSVQRVFDGGGF